MYPSQGQAAQNKIAGDLLMRYALADLGQRGDSEGGKRTVIFVGFRRGNKHVLKAEEVRWAGYCDELRLIACRD